MPQLRSAMKHHRLVRRGEGTAPRNSADPGVPEDESDRPHPYPDEGMSARLSTRAWGTGFPRA
ncbi:MAG: hypothetical protein AAF767_02435 [Pseudomonadota bacterium]